MINCCGVASWVISVAFNVFIHSFIHNIQPKHHKTCFQTFIRSKYIFSLLWLLLDQWPIVFARICEADVLMIDLGNKDQVNTV